ncbi:hypothetical protein [Streptomyces sp. NPDC059639]|uniref:hypothetical protein n=1 Tax=Streptomyces sp. NPDC059639 TaxID=3346891 RepID=UPI0036797616
MAEPSDLNHSLGQGAFGQICRTGISRFHQRDQHKADPSLAAASINTSPSSGTHCQYVPLRFRSRGYDVHSTRRDDWSDESGLEITEQEWEAVVTADPDLQMVPAAPSEGQPLRWTAEMVTHPPEKRFGTAVHWFSPTDISAKNPTDTLIRKIQTLARALDARVQGDDGEYYD